MAVVFDGGAGRGVVSNVENVKIDKCDNHKDQEGTWSDSERY
jgi:hypothetical protein